MGYHCVANIFGTSGKFGLVSHDDVDFLEEAIDPSLSMSLEDGEQEFDFDLYLPSGHLLESSESSSDGGKMRLHERAQLRCRDREGSERVSPMHSSEALH